MCTHLACACILQTQVQVLCGGEERRGHIHISLLVPTSHTTVSLALPSITAKPRPLPALALTTAQRMMVLSADPLRHCEKCSLKRQTYTALEWPFITACMVNTYLSEDDTQGEG